MKKMVKVRFYGDVIIDAEIAEALNIFSKLVPVDYDGYGKDAKYSQKESDVDFQLIDDSQFIRESNEEGTIAYLKSKLDKVEKDYTSANSERYQYKTDLQKLKDEIEILRKACPKVEVEDE
jgi:hypothetical protein